jgi:NTP pyrophosphohydrolases including oxidative damage repair enzymes
MTGTDRLAGSIRVELLIHDGRGRILLDQEPGHVPSLPHTYAPAWSHPVDCARDAARRFSTHSVTGRILARQRDPSRPGLESIVVIDGGLLTARAVQRVDHQGGHNLALHHIGAARSSLAEPDAARLRHAALAWALGDQHQASFPGPPRPTYQYAWRGLQAVPSDVPIRQVWGWLITDDGGLLILLDHRGVASLPGGRPEPDDQGPTQTLQREAAEEAQVTLGPAVHLGWQEVHEPGQPPYAQVRLAAAITAVHHSQLDPDSGIHYRRLVVPLNYANFVLGWGPEGDAQATAAIRAAQAHGLPRPQAGFPVRTI